MPPHITTVFVGIPMLTKTVVICEGIYMPSHITTVFVSSGIPHALNDITWIYILRA